MRGDWIRNAATDAPVLVYVHGFLSTSDTCWRHSNGTYWPDVLANDDQLSDVGIYVFSYMTSLLSGTYRVADAVDALREHMLLDGLVERKRLFFICHSMGGIVVRKYLVDHAADLAARKSEIGLFLLASPSQGSRYANRLRFLGELLRHKQAEILRFGQQNSWLRDLDRDFTNLKEENRFPLSGKELVEDHSIFGKIPWIDQVVQAYSGAKYFAHPYKVPKSDHFSIAKIDGPDAVQHRLLRLFVRKSAFGWEPAPEDAVRPAERTDVMMNAFAPDRGDNISMRIRSRDDGRVVLEELVYRFDKDIVENEERVCLKSLEVEWNWGESQRVALDGRWLSRSARSNAMSADNPGIQIGAAQHDAAMFSVHLSPAAPDAALAPAEDEAFSALLLPGADIVAAPGERHKFSVKARKQHLCLARRDPEDGHFKPLGPQNGTLMSQTDTLARAAATALVEVEHGFPEDGSPLVLGVREAEALPRRPRFPAARDIGGETVS